MNILHILVGLFFLLTIILFVLLINTSKESFKVALGIACGTCLLFAMSFMADQHRFQYDEENPSSLRHLGVEYYHVNGNGTTTNTITGEVFVSDVVPTMYGARLHLYRDGKLVKEIIWN